MRRTKQFMGLRMNGAGQADAAPHDFLKQRAAFGALVIPHLSLDG
jgi:hypothetical protein